jgi:hypothetical protein
MINKEVSSDPAAEPEFVMYIRGHHSECDGLSTMACVWPLFMDAELVQDAPAYLKDNWTRSKATLTKIEDFLGGNCTSEEKKDTPSSDSQTTEVHASRTTPTWYYGLFRLKAVLDSLLGFLLTPVTIVK